MSVRLSRDEAWTLLTEWVASESLRRHCLAVEAVDARLRAPAARTRSCGASSASSTTSTTSAIPTSRRAIRAWRWPSSRRATSTPSWSGRSPRTRTSWASRATRRSSSTLYAVDELLGLRPRLRLRAPGGPRRASRPKSVKKKLKQPSFAAAVNRDEVRAGRRGARRRLRRARRLRHRRPGGARRRARRRRLARRSNASARRPWPRPAGGRRRRRRRRCGARRDGARAARGGRRAGRRSARSGPGRSSGSPGSRIAPGLPVRALDRPGHDVLEPAERGAALARRLGRAEAIVGRRRDAAPAAHRAAHRSPQRSGRPRRLAVSWRRDGRPSEDRDPRGRRDRAGAARAGRPGARPRRRRPRARARALRPLAREPPRDRQRASSHEAAARDARGRLRRQGGDDHARGRATTSAPPTASCARRSTARSSSARAGASPASRPWRASTTRSPSCGWPSRTPTAPSEWREGERGRPRRGRLPHRAHHALDVCRAVAEYAFRTARKMRGARLRRAEVDGLAGLRGDAQGGARRRRRSATPTSPYQPVLIDATYAGLIGGRGRRPARDPGAQPRRRLPAATS